MGDTTMNDAINPNHYTKECSLECIDVMRATFGLRAVIDFCLCNAFKYMWRYKNKNGVEDLNKASWYLSYIEKASEAVPTQCMGSAYRLRELLNDLMVRNELEAE